MNEENINSRMQKSRLGGDLEGLNSSPLGRLGGASLSRKEFLKTLARYGFLVLIVFLGVFLLTNRKTKVEEECTNDFRCGGCSKRENCKIKASPNPSQGGAK
jgi:hypothetical protein